MPLLNRITSMLGVAMLVFLAVWAAIESPGWLLAALGAFLTLNLLYGLASTSSRIEASPAPPRIWLDLCHDLHGLDWSHLGTWVLDLGGKNPEVAVHERPADGARVVAVGAAVKGGVVEVQSCLDGGTGYLTTLNKPSRTVRPPWMFKQAVGRPIPELIRAHDEALQYLRAMGIVTVPFPSGDPLDAIRAEHRMMNQFYKRRWWLVAIGPVVNRVTPSRSKQLHEQSDIERQVDRYRQLITRERSAPRPAAS